jgi:hypothetical protein
MAIEGQDSARAVTVADDKADKLLQIITGMDRAALWSASWVSTV